MKCFENRNYRSFSDVYSTNIIISRFLLPSNYHLIPTDLCPCINPLLFMCKEPVNRGYQFLDFSKLYSKGETILCGLVKSCEPFKGRVFSGWQQTRNSEIETQ